jgi:hypothetical protein
MDANQFRFLTSTPEACTPHFGLKLGSIAPQWLCVRPILGAACQRSGALSVP